MTLRDSQVLIVGAGPTGLMLALELARQQISFTIIDKKSHVSQVMKATAISSVALEGFDDFNFCKPFEETAVFTHALSIFYEGKTALHIPWVGIESKYPNYCLIGQNHVEQIQESFLNELGHQVQWDVSLIDFKNNQDNVCVTLESNGRKKECVFDYVTGCDGAHSLVRDLAKIEIQGKKYPDHYVIADVKIEGDFKKNDWYFFLSKAVLEPFQMIGGGYCCLYPKVKRLKKVKIQILNIHKRYLINWVYEDLSGFCDIGADFWTQKSDF